MSASMDSKLIPDAAAGSGGLQALLGWAGRHPLLRPLAALAALLLIDFFLVPGFFRLEIKDGHLYGALVDIVNRAAPLMLAALGMTLVIATRGVDISVGAVVAISGAVAALLIGGKMVVVDGVSQYVSNVPMAWALAAAIGAALLCGAWNGLLVAVLGLQPIIATLILMVAGRGLAQLLTDGQIITVYYKPFFFIGGGYLFGLPFSLYIALGMFVLLAVLMRKTALGLFIQSVGINPVASRLAGIRTAALIFFVYIFCSFCAGLAGLMVASNIKSADANNAGLLLELDAILAVTLGGTSLAGGKFSLVGSVIGALIIQTLTYTIYSLGVPPEVNMVVKSLVVFLVCLSQSPEFRRIFKAAKS
ncbi:MULTISPECIES: ABC transporter permease [unclassified Herbaspirillum]|uniref:ABC transporter permease n=1 Tax=unclassified Herbaspirillum TaxID=2624150 RepID=UPI001153F022|nr:MULTISPECIES: ABC transporter permease [unclassified Herbaspirillum]MBB5390666.1 simple sugar transport system permease protein [Herbaspirillum sp. SJZ102]TQK08848.1 monosaccharide ABC transporter membrane protein (CUT2 family) [Herbaspirillum sp. SJZ130]TQK14465.1 monosaccharide ABC transporter membrane protein (CUT2 family) [Herbaspirillum sp. SJZ106]TWC66518.1 monosaccharide ABC transporter membrane protein (CUT2 family) [Herbaspirillum sp. SJZ099]